MHILMKICKQNFSHDICMVYSSLQTQNNSYHETNFEVKRIAELCIAKLLRTRIKQSVLHESKQLGALRLSPAPLRMVRQKFSCMHEVLGASYMFNIYRDISISIHNCDRHITRERY